MILLAAVAGLAAAAQADERSRSMRAEFVRQHPCPSTGKTRGACPGYQVDHVQALCAGGTDHPSNMAWITVPDHKRKSAKDTAVCRAQRAGVLQR